MTLITVQNRDAIELIVLPLTILDDYSRYIIAWELRSTMRADDVTDTLELALVTSGCDSAKVVHKPRLLDDNGSSYISSDLAEWLKDRGIAHVRGALCHPHTQGKIGRWHQTLKNRILLVLHAQRPPGLSSMGVGSNETRAPVEPNGRQCFTLELTAEVAFSWRNSPS